MSLPQSSSSNPPPQAAPSKVKEAWWSRTKKWFYYNPLGKTLTFVFSVIVSGVLCGGFVNEITLEQEVRWDLFYTSTCFYLIIIYSIFILIYHIILFREDDRITKFADNQFCIAYIRSQLLPAIVSLAVQDINSGKPVHGFTDIKSVLEELS